MPRETIGKDEKKIKNFLDDIDQEMDQFKEEHISKGWDDIPDFYEGKNQWGEDRPSHKLSPVLNFIQQSIERKVSQMTDTKPFMDILPYNDSLNEVSQALEAIVAAKWSEQSLDMTLTELLRDKGVEIETRLGTLYGVARAFDAERFIHAYYDDPREMYFNRLLYKSFKSFCMSYARMETRSVYHWHFGNRSGSLIPRAIFDSDFIQERYAFSCVLRTSPAGIIGVDASTDLYDIDRRITRHHLETYGKMQRLFGEIEDCVAVWDGGRWGYYLHAGGLVFGVLLTNDRDPFDLNVPVLASMLQDPRDPYVFSNNPILKAVVVNQAWVGANIPYMLMPLQSPMFVVGQEQAELWRRDSSNPIAGAQQTVVETLEEGLARACEVGGTDKIIVFDGSFGSLTVSPAMAEFLRSRADSVRRRVDGELLPMWLRQRGLEEYVS